MIFKNIFKDLNISQEDYFYLIILTALSILITYFLIILNENIGIYCSDVFIYLTNSLVFAGYGSSRVYLYLSPIICILTSILFRLGVLSELSLYIVTGAFSILGNIGLYVFLKNRFNPLLSFCGAILFGSFSLNLLWWANGTLDVPAMALSLWAIIFLINAIDNDSRYYVMAIPLLALAVFTRYTALFLVPLFLLYFLSKHDFFSNLEILIFDRQEFIEKSVSYLKSQEFKDILKACGLALVLILLFSAIILSFGSHLSFLTQSSTFASGSKGELDDNAYTTDTFYYLHEFPSFLFADNVVFEDQNPILVGSSFVSYFLIALFVLGIILAVYKLIKRKNESHDNLDLGFDKKPEILDNPLAMESDINLDSHLAIESDIKVNGNSAIKIENEFINKYFRYFVGFLSVFLLIMAILSFRVNSIITLTILLVDFVILFSFLKKNNVDRDLYALNILVLSWFLVYFIFFTFLNIKVNRYIITVFPAFIYFAIFAINEIVALAKKYDFLKFRNKNILNIIPIALIIFCIFSAFAFPSAVHYDDEFNRNKVIADYLMEYDSDYNLKEIAAFNQRSLNWYLKDNTIALTDDQLDYLESSNITYYISDNNFNLENYTMIYGKGGVYLFERIA